MKRLRRKDHVYKYPTINADSFDKRRFNELLLMSKGLQKAREKGKDEPYFEQLMGDTWASFYKSEPKLLDETIPELIKNKNLMKRILNNDELYQETHQYTVLDDLHSALSTITFSNKILEWIKERTKSNPDMQQTYDQMKQQQKQNGKNSKEFQEALQNYLEKFNEQLEKDSPDISTMLRESCESAKQAEKELENLLGGIESGKSSKDELKQIPLRDQFTLAECLQRNKKMKRIADWAGRFKAIALSKQKSINKESITRSGITFGNNIDRILPNELLNMSNPVLKNDFLRRFVEGQTLQYATKGKQSLGKGAIILCLDQSGSMSDIDDQSKGFTLALMSIAKRQKRDFALVTFDGHSQVKLFPKGKITIKQMVELCESFMGGGTNFINPLSDSLKLIKGNRFKNADIVFVTDGNASLPDYFIDYFLEEKKKLGFSVLSLLIGNISESTIKEFSDEIHCAKDFKDENAHELFKI